MIPDLLKKKNTSMLKSKSPTGLFIPFIWLVILKRHSNQSEFSYYVYTISENLIKYLIINATPSRRVNTLEDVHVRWFSGNHCHCCFSMSLNCTYISFWTVGKTTHFLVVCYNNAQLKESNFLLVGHYYIDDISMCRTPCHPSQ